VPVRALTTSVPLLGKDAAVKALRYSSHIFYRRLRQGRDEGRETMSQSSFRLCLALEDPNRRAIARVTEVADSGFEVQAVAVYSVEKIPVPTIRIHALVSRGGQRDSLGRRCGLSPGQEVFDRLCLDHGHILIAAEVPESQLPYWVDYCKFKCAPPDSQLGVHAGKVLVWKNP
jgi:hypothetical protein